MKRPTGDDKAAILRNLTEIGLKIVITGTRSMEPLSEKLLAYLENDADQIRDHFKRQENFDPLVVTINNKTWVFNMRSFIEDALTPVFETTTIIIK